MCYKPITRLTILKREREIDVAQRHLSNLGIITKSSGTLL
jgi:hypothetical protein